MPTIIVINNIRIINTNHIAGIIQKAKVAQNQLMLINPNSFNTVRIIPVMNPNVLRPSEESLDTIILCSIILHQDCEQL